MRTSKIFGYNLKKIRKDLNLSQEKFAEIIDIQTRSLSDIENGKYLPHPDNIDKISDKLKIPISKLFIEVEEQKELNEKQEKINKLLLKLSILSDENLEIISKIINSL